MQDLISSSYSKEEAGKFFQYTLSNVDTRAIVQAGMDILQHIPQIPYACAHMSALWGARIRDSTSIPTHVVAGNLFMNKRKIFFSDDNLEKVKRAFETSNAAWHGHVWVSFAGRIGDISLFRSAYAEPQEHWFHQLIVQEFGRGRGLLLGPPSNMIYEAKYVLTDENINALIRGMQAFL
jgi:hypothetical protein